MLAALDPSRDLRLSGQVIYTGRSSMEVAVKMESIGGDKPDETVLLGTLFVVSLHHVNLNSFIVCSFPVLTSTTFAVTPTCCSWCELGDSMCQSVRG